MVFCALASDRKTKSNPHEEFKDQSPGGFFGVVELNVMVVSGHMEKENGADFSTHAYLFPNVFFIKKMSAELWEVMEGVAQSMNQMQCGDCCSRLEPSMAPWCIRK